MPEADVSAGAAGRRVCRIRGLGSGLGFVFGPRALVGCVRWTRRRSLVGQRCVMGAGWWSWFPSDGLVSHCGEIRFRRNL